MLVALVALVGDALFFLPNSLFFKGANVLVSFNSRVPELALKQ